MRGSAMLCGGAIADDNIGHLIDIYGFVPNGGRIYYLNRSQPPLLTWCLDAYLQATGDVDFLRRAMGWLEKETDFFTKHKSYHRPEWASPLFRYHVVSEGPRPESYREDRESAEHIEDPLEKRRLWGDIAAAAESGRDFSARWFHNVGPMAGKMGSTRTSSILPVDLNAIICGNLRLRATFYEALGDHERAERATRQFEAMRDTIHRVFWSEEHGCWFDYDIATNQHITVYYDTNFFPLFTGCTHEGFNAKSVVDYLQRAGVLQFPGGVPTSLITSGEQWDFPNAWAPTTWVIIQGLRLSGETEMARAIAEKWIQRNYAIFKQSGGRMFEKYNVASECFRNASGGGGEYETQEGFGWTNGVVLDLLMTYGTELSWPDDFLSQYVSTAKCECCRPQARVVNELLSSELRPVVAADVHMVPEHNAEAALLELQDLAPLSGLEELQQADMQSLQVPVGEAPDSVVESLVSADLFCQLPGSRRPSFSAAESAVEALFGSTPLDMRPSRRPSFSTERRPSFSLAEGSGLESLAVEDYSTSVLNSVIHEEPPMVSDLKVMQTEDGLLIEERPSDEALAAMANVAVQMMANAAAAHSLEHSMEQDAHNPYI